MPAKADQWSREWRDACDEVTVRCARALCRESFVKCSWSNRLYCSDACSYVVRYARHVVRRRTEREGGY